MKKSFQDSKTGYYIEKVSIESKLLNQKGSKKVLKLYFALFEEHAAIIKLSLESNDDF